MINSSSKFLNRRRGLFEVVGARRPKTVPKPVLWANGAAQFTLDRKRRSQ